MIVPAALSAGERVVPLAGTRIEIRVPIPRSAALLSSPSRGRGLKSYSAAANSATVLVVPLAGTWIETCHKHRFPSCQGVVPLAGTWIKIYGPDRAVRIGGVVPLAGTRIEIGAVWRHSRGREDVVPLAGTWIKHGLKVRSRHEQRGIPVLFHTETS